jgi:succinyl-diaminopimelate desuccinylase
MSAVIDLLKHLISRPSITPNDAGCQELIANRLKKLGFNIEKMRFNQVDNLWARFGTESPLLVFAGHTDVVPPGQLSAWSSDPFTPSERDGFLYGRGAADMKGGLAAMIAAVESFLEQQTTLKGSIAFLITSDEEGPHNTDGTQKVIEKLQQRGEKIDYCIVGEASSDNLLGDQIRVGRRGSLSGKLSVYGKQGHIAYPHLAINPIHAAAPVISELAKVTWDEGNEFFPPTSFQISNIHGGTGAGNVIPGLLELHFNFRFSTASTVETLQQKVLLILEKNKLNFDLQWEPCSYPFLTKKGKFLQKVVESIKEIAGLDPILSTGGGTSDGRFIAPTGAEVIELGPINATAHQTNESINLNDLELLVQLYKKILDKIF